MRTKSIASFAILLAGVTALACQPADEDTTMDETAEEMMDDAGDMADTAMEEAGEMADTAAAEMEDAAEEAEDAMNTEE